MELLFPKKLPLLFLLPSLELPKPLKQETSLVQALFQISLVGRIILFLDLHFGFPGSLLEHRSIGLFVESIAGKPHSHPMTGILVPQTLEKVKTRNARYDRSQHVVKKWALFT